MYNFYIIKIKNDLFKNKAIFSFDVKYIYLHTVYCISL